MHCPERAKRIGDAANISAYAIASFIVIALNLEKVFLMRLERRANILFLEKPADSVFAVSFLFSQTKNCKLNVMQNLIYILLFLVFTFAPTALFSQGNNKAPNLNADQNIKVIELRNYLVRGGRRDEFINLFEENFVQSQNILGGYILGQYRIKGAADNFLWIRGFKDMPARYKFLNDFYFGSPFWKQHKSEANSMLLNNDNVYLLRPLNLKDSTSDADFSFNTNWFGQEKGVAVIDFYTSNTKREKLIEFIKKKYAAILNASKIENASFWTSETIPNDFTGLPVFQDKNLLVQMTFYKNEVEYQKKMKESDSKMNDEVKSEMADLVTIKNTLVIYPTEKSFLLQKK